MEDKESEIVEVKKRGRGSKRKEEYNNRKAKRAVAAMLESIQGITIENILWLMVGPDVNS